MASTTIDLDTELSAVNSILGAIGQSPITQLKDPTTGAITNANPEIQFIYNLLKDANVDVQSEGWHFNKEKHVAYTADSVTGKIAIGADVLQMDVTDGWKEILLLMLGGFVGSFAKVIDFWFNNQENDNKLLEHADD